MTSFVLGGGCFWCLDSTYMQFKGVQDVEVGYMGGQVSNPSYEQVCEGNTDHVEVARVIFDETVVPADVILDMFFTLHDPTQLNRQGNDVGTQYRSAMLYGDEAQEVLFEAARERAVVLWGEGIVTVNLLARRGIPPRFLCQEPKPGLLQCGCCTKNGEGAL